MDAILANAQVNPDTWAHVPRTYIRTTNDHVIPPAVQDRMIGEADALAQRKRGALRWRNEAAVRDLAKDLGWVDYARLPAPAPLHGGVAQQVVV